MTNNGGETPKAETQSSLFSRLARPVPLLFGLGLLSGLPYLYTLSLGNLRDETPGFLTAFLTAFNGSKRLLMDLIYCKYRWNTLWIALSRR